MFTENIFSLSLSYLCHYCISTQPEPHSRPGHRILLCGRTSLEACASPFYRPSSFFKLPTIPSPAGCQPPLFHSMFSGIYISALSFLTLTPSVPFHSFCSYFWSLSLVRT